MWRTWEEPLPIQRCDAGARRTERRPSANRPTNTKEGFATEVLLQRTMSYPTSATHSDGQEVQLIDAPHALSFAFLVLAALRYSMGITKSVM
jgi:hypothetical protein